MDQRNSEQRSQLAAKDDRYFRTPNLYLAAYLFSKDLWLVNIDRTDRKNCLFVFKNTPEREELVLNYRYGKEAPVDARKYAYAVRKLKAKLYERNF